MRSWNISNFEDIKVIEKFILGSSLYSPVSLGKNLQQLRTLRKDLYDSLGKDLSLSEDVKSKLIEEYINYCKFNEKMCSKKLSNAVFARISQAFIDDYDIIKTFDEDKTAYQLTLKTLDNIKISLKESNDKMRNYKMNGVEKLKIVFIENNCNQEELLV